MGAVPGVYYQGNNGLQGSDAAIQNTNSPQNTGGLTIQPAFTSPFSGVYNPQVSGGATLTQGASSAPAATATAAPDPYAAYGGRAAYNGLVSGFNTQKSAIYSTANDAAKNSGISLQNSILDLIDSLRSGQRGIDNKAINNEIAKRQGTQTVLDAVGRGIRSGGVMLANKNATDSSAAGAIAKAYGDIGRRNLSQVGNQYETTNRDIAQQQDELNTMRASGVRKISSSKEQTVNSIVADAQSKLAALDAAIAGANLPQRIAIEQEKEAVRQQVLGQLSQYDKLLSDQTSAINPLNSDQRLAEANKIINAGQAPANTFDFGNNTQAQFQDSGPFASQLPIFLAPKRKNQTA